MASYKVVDDSESDSEFEDDEEDKWDDFSTRMPHRNVVENQEFWVPRDLLSEQSQVFAALFYGPFEESRQEKILLPNKLASEILEMLRCVIPTGLKRKGIEAKNLVLLHRLADEYQLEILASRCKLYLPGMLRDKDETLKVFRDAVTYQQESIASKAFPAFCRNDLNLLKPILETFPAQVNLACLYQIVGQTRSCGHLPVLSNCDQCENGSLKFCAKCKICNLPSVWKDPEHDYENACNCIDAFAAIELEKIGL